MEPPPKPLSTGLFQVYLRLRPSQTSQTSNHESLYPLLHQPGRFLTVETSQKEDQSGLPTHITITPPIESRRRAVEKFAFTKVFEEGASQLDLFKGTGALPLIEKVLGTDGHRGRDGLLATLGVTGSGKTHTILGSKSQRGLTQLTLDVLFRSLGSRLLHPSTALSLMQSLTAADPSESQLVAAPAFLDHYYGDPHAGGYSRGATPMTDITSTYSAPSRRHVFQRPSNFARAPDVGDLSVAIDQAADYAIVVSMYEVYNDRIFDLLNGQAVSSAGQVKSSAQRDLRRRPLLFKSTERSPNRKVVAGLTKVVCGTVEEALIVLETGLTERRVAGTGSNLASSRSHGFFCLEVKKRNRYPGAAWLGSTMTIVDLAGSERAREAKTAGATLAEAGKINESLMYLGQCLQMQSDSNLSGTKPTLVPFRQCKLTELLFSNSFPSATSSQGGQSTHYNPQKAVMIVTADALGDFNATSQILRYSALAREVTVPRIPSVTSTILSSASSQSRNMGRDSPTSISSGEIEFAAHEINRLSEDLEIMQVQLAEERLRRQEAESNWQAAEVRIDNIEQDIREECSEEMDRRLQEERTRWMNAQALEADYTDQHIDRKLDMLSRTIQIHEDPEPSIVDRVSDLEKENSQLLMQIEQLKRKLGSSSPTRPKASMTPLACQSPAQPEFFHEGETDISIVEGVRKLRLRDSEGLPTLAGLMEKENESPLSSKSSSPAKTPGKKMRKLTTRKWDLAPEDEI